MSDSTPTTPPDGRSPGDRRCPACGVDALHNVTTSGYCRNCGHDFVRRAPRVGVHLGIDLRAVARHQRRLVLIVLLIAGATVLLIAMSAALPLGRGVASRAGMSIASMLSSAGWIVGIGGSLVAMIVMVQLLVAMRFGVLMTGLHVILALAPCFNILVLVSASSQATQTLRAAGLKVGLLGVSDEQVVRMLSPNRCRQCGYILMGNSRDGRCPECGATQSPDD